MILCEVSGGWRVGEPSKVNGIAVCGAMRHAFGKGTLSGIALEDGKNQAVVVVLP
jgi:hypothetical protein